MTSGDYIISTDRNLLSLDRTCELLNGTYWAGRRSRETIAKSIAYSVCVGVYHQREQVGFARAVTDHATIYWLCDVVIDEQHRGRGLGRKMVKYLTELPELRGLTGILATRDAHGLYEKYDFQREPDIFMRRKVETAPVGDD